ncbi:MAG: hypothetical protein COU46_02130 [Candidatus Niyogibacteria bacterium CG10_big_fil_rev_8_21_14_0_10_42_19]|uniref:TraC-like domain-containing protein n=1 Tax=Candidatus Niyogibacteria bacterium CG10_big_fil_rev_8_21_14_0_10_42_19 TaxID=1974725 RepID=A0A2H0TFI1_9BACT|nr:MAG: hypothetical protein COU46_02130 [Candidatus Niyogibacteria bacterium CG10_big_fil_rev_8_21_14_0_10_42_19]
MAQLKAKPSQNFVPIQEIRDGVVILKDKTMHAVIMASSLNFALKSSDEQEAIISQYQNFLNSLDFSIQFVIQSRKLDLDPYLETMRDAEKKLTSELLQIQTREYVEFIKTFVKAANIVSKTFYVVISYSPPFLDLDKSDGGLFSAFNKITGLGSGSAAAYIPDEKFEEYKVQLWQRVEIVQSGLGRCGVRGVQLNTEELVELYYNAFNPGEAGKGKTPQISAT